jgi:outer membrane protein assembly factor BamE (lipoprotein component of BamABCDE complex)
MRCIAVMATPRIGKSRGDTRHATWDRGRGDRAFDGYASPQGKGEEALVRTLMTIGCVAVLLVGCVGGAGEVRWRYHEQYTRAQKNREALAGLHPGMPQSEVRAVMGEPEMVEEQPKGATWLYRTAVSSLAPTSPEADFTPLVFDEQKRLVGWGREALSTRGAPGPPQPLPAPGVSPEAPGPRQ